MRLQFVESESTFAYFHATRAYLEAWGKPVAFYSDKHGVFRVNHEGALGGDGMTQFGRALDALNIDIICANSSQAKGRVERAHKTLQDRLVKEVDPIIANAALSSLTKSIVLINTVHVRQFEAADAGPTTMAAAPQGGTPKRQTRHRQRARTEAHEPGGRCECAQRAERRQMTVNQVKIPQASAEKLSFAASNYIEHLRRRSLANAGSVCHGDAEIIGGVP